MRVEDISENCVAKETLKSTTTRWVCTLQKKKGKKDSERTKRSKDGEDLEAKRMPRMSGIQNDMRTISGDRNLCVYGEEYGRGRDCSYSLILRHTGIGKVSWIE